MTCLVENCTVCTSPMPNTLVCVHVTCHSHSTDPVLPQARQVKRADSSDQSIATHRNVQSDGGLHLPSGVPDLSVMSEL